MLQRSPFWVMISSKAPRLWWACGLSKGPSGKSRPAPEESPGPPHTHRTAATRHQRGMAAPTGPQQSPQGRRRASRATAPVTHNRRVWRRMLSRPGKVQPVATLRFKTTGREGMTCYVYVNTDFVPGL